MSCLSSALHCVGRFWAAHLALSPVHTTKSTSSAHSFFSQSIVRLTRARGESQSLECQPHTRRSCKKTETLTIPVCPISRQFPLSLASLHLLQQGRRLVDDLPIASPCPSSCGTRPRPLCQLDSGGRDGNPSNARNDLSVLRVSWIADPSSRSSRLLRLDEEAKGACSSADTANAKPKTGKKRESFIAGPASCSELHKNNEGEVNSSGLTPRVA